MIFPNLKKVNSAIDSVDSNVNNDRMICVGGLEIYYGKVRGFNSIRRVDHLCLKTEGEKEFSVEGILYLSNIQVSVKAGYTVDLWFISKTIEGTISGGVNRIGFKFKINVNLENQKLELKKFYFNKVRWIPLLFE